MVEISEIFKLILSLLGNTGAYISIVLIIFHAMLSWISNFSQRIAVGHVADACNSTSPTIFKSHVIAFVTLDVSAVLIGLFSLGVLCAALYYYVKSMSINYRRYKRRSTETQTCREERAKQIGFFHTMVIEFFGTTGTLYLSDYLG